MGTIAIMYRRFTEPKVLTLGDAFESIMSDLQSISLTFLQHFKGFKLAIYVDCVLEDLQSEETKRRRFYSPHQSNLHDSSMQTMFYSAYNNLLTGLSLNQRDGSGFKLKFVEGVELRYAQLLHFNTGGDYIPTPPELTKKHRSLINIRTFNSNCFLYSCLVQMYKPEILKMIYPEKSPGTKLTKNRGKFIQ
jgi:hypothetical protein